MRHDEFRVIKILHREFQNIYITMYIFFGISNINTSWRISTYLLYYVCTPLKFEIFRSLHTYICQIATYVFYNVYDSDFITVHACWNHTNPFSTFVNTFNPTLKKINTWYVPSQRALIFLRRFDRER